MTTSTLATLTISRRDTSVSAAHPALTTLSLTMSRPRRSLSAVLDLRPSSKSQKANRD
jgi:hypothetical protein